MYQILWIVIALIAMRAYLFYWEIKVNIAKEAFRKELRKKYLVSRYLVEIEQRKKCAECVVGGIKLCKI